MLPKVYFKQATINLEVKFKGVYNFGFSFFIYYKSYLSFDRMTKKKAKEGIS